MTDPNIIAVSFPAMEAAAMQLKADSSKLNGFLEEMEQGVQPMLATWNGDDRRRYDEDKKVMDATAINLVRSAQKIAAGVQQAYELYLATSNKTAAMWSR